MSSTASVPGKDIPLPALPSGRPRRLLLFLPGLQPDDVVLRAFDLARHLHAHGGWFARAISATDGPYRSVFESAAIPVQVIDSIADPAAVARQVWGAQQDAAIAFDNAITWAGPLATRHGWPLLHETQERRAWFDPFASPGRRNELRSALGLTHATRLALAFATETRDESGLLALLGAAQAALAEAALVEWKISLVGADGRLTCVTDKSPPAELPVDLAPPARSDWVAAADAVLDLHKHGTGFRPLLDAAALAVPVVADSTPSLCALLPAPLFAPAERDSPTDIADALIDLAINPEARARRVASAHVFAMAHRNPARLLSSWIAALEAAVVSR